MSELLREYVKLSLTEGDRGGIDAQAFIADVFKKLRPKFDYISNKKGQQNPDVTIMLKGEAIGYVESKSIAGGASLTTVYDKTIGSNDVTPLDDVARALNRENVKRGAGVDLPKEGAVIGQFLKSIGGELSTERPVSKADAERCKKNPGGYSHTPVKLRVIPAGIDSDTLFFQMNPEDREKIANNEKIVILLDRGGRYYALGTVKPVKIGNKTLLSTTSTPRPWVSSGKAPTEGGIGTSKQTITAAYNAMVDHWSHGEGGDNYFVLVGSGVIYPFIVPGKDDVLNLSKLGVKELSISDIKSAGLATYGNPGFGKMRLGLKASFVLGKSFTL